MSGWAGFEKSIGSSSGQGVRAEQALDEREETLSEGRHAGASERLFESLTSLKE
jgi:hypothetical protein